MTSPAPSTTAHLDALAGDTDGWLVVSQRDEQGRWRSWSFPASAVDDAAQCAHQLDREPRNVHVRTNLLRRPLRHPGERGSAGDTGAVTALAVDLDVQGPGHNHGAGLPLPATSAEALAIVDGLPAPTLTISTGGGFHLWWMLDRPVTDQPVELLNQWADRIVGAARSRRLHVDRPDPARVLRVCGTHRRKVDQRTGELLVNRVTLDAVAGWPTDGVLDRRPWRPAGRYTPAELLDALPAPTAPPKPAQATQAAQGTPQRPPRPSSAVGPADAVARLTWAQILEPAGWQFVRNGHIGGAPCELWRRPGASSEYSIKCLVDGPAVAWSDQCGLPAGPGQKLNKWRVFVHLHHQGDERAAGQTVRRLARELSR